MADIAIKLVDVTKVFPGVRALNLSLIHISEKTRP